VSTTSYKPSSIFRGESYPGTNIITLQHDSPILRRYGVIHFIVSVIFFISLLILVSTYAYIFKEYVLPLLAIAIGVISWVLHLIYRIPKGAAIPELISIFITLPFYMRYAVRVCRSFNS